MCLHVNYRYDLCSNPKTQWASWPPNYKSICIEPCSLAYNTDGELDHAQFGICHARTDKTIHVNSPCTKPQCKYCRLPPREPADPLFEGLIKQGIRGQTGSRFPKVDEMVWHIPEVHMRIDCLNNFTWDQPPKKRKRSTDLDESDSSSSDEEYKDPPSPKTRLSRPAGEYERIAPSNYEQPRRKGLLNALACSLDLPGSSTRKNPPPSRLPRRQKLSASKACQTARQKIPSSKAGQKNLADRSKPIKVAVPAALTKDEDPFVEVWDWSAESAAKSLGGSRATRSMVPQGVIPHAKRIKAHNKGQCLTL